MEHTATEQDGKRERATTAANNPAVTVIRVCQASAGAGRDVFSTDSVRMGLSGQECRFLFHASRILGQAGTGRDERLLPIRWNGGQAEKPGGKP